MNKYHWIEFLFIDSDGYTMDGAEHTQDLITFGLITPDPNGGYEVTPKGERLIEQLHTLYKD